MNGRVATTLLLALLTTVHLGVTSAQGPDDQAKLDVQNLEKQWREAWVRGDAEALDLIHANDYLVINNLGQFNTKAQVMSDVRAGALHPDIEARPTIAEITAGRDEVLERAVTFLNTGR